MGNHMHEKEYDKIRKGRERKKAMANGETFLKSIRKSAVHKALDIGENCDIIKKVMHDKQILQNDVNGEVIKDNEEIFNINEMLVKNEIITEDADDDV